ncbi:GAF and ANTAR domain-containing protein [Paenarthrobacter sp. NPDC057355]|uniref:GAF and ANTAR domain-containing protein n=1 Tax=Paenarthrobacter sp. NPDC057355 TaxID=3346105 RepID=UPI003640FF71
MQNHLSEIPDSTPPAAPTDLTYFLERIQDLLIKNADIPCFLDELVDMTADELTTSANPVACGMTVMRQKRPVAVADSSPLARQLDEIQNRLGDGPCLTALRTRTMTHVPDIRRENRWPAYMQAVENTNVGAILALPLDVNSTSAAVVNLYSAHPHGFDEEDVLAAQRVTATGAKALHLAIKFSQLRDARENLVAALDSRATIDTAVGIIMAQSRCNRDAAFQILVDASSHRNMKLRAVAEAVVARIAGDRQLPVSFEE